MKGVIYARYSSDSQNETSIEGQLEVNYKFAKENNITIVKEYIDRAITGKTDKRPSFLKMIDDAKKQCFDCVIIYAIDRFARNPTLHTIYESQLNQYGITVLSATQDLVNKSTPESVLVKEFFKGLAGYYSANLSQSVLRGIGVQKHKCKYTGGGIPFGYKIDEEKNYIIDPVSSVYLKQVFNLYLSGEQVTKIAEYLNNNGFKTSRGTAFRKQSIYKLLTNEKYIGVFRYKDYVNENGIPAIIDAETFNKVQDLVNRVHKKPIFRNKERFLLSGKVFCGECNNPLVGTAGTGKNKVYHYYSCKNKCYKNYKKEFLEDFVISNTRESILQEDILLHISKVAYDVYVKAIRNDTTVKDYQKQLSKINKSISNIIKAIEEGIITSSTKDRLTALEKEKQDIELLITKASLNNKELPFEYIVFYFANLLLECNDAKKITELFINSVIVYKDRIVIIYNCTDTNTGVRLQSTVVGSRGLEPLRSLARF